MRRGTMLVLGLLAVAIALPQTASARPRGVPNLLGIITNPIGAILGGVSRLGRRATPHRRPIASRTRPAAPVTAAAPAAAGVAGAAAATAAVTATQASPSQTNVASEASANVPIPVPAPEQKTLTPEPTTVAAAPADSVPSATTGNVTATPAESAPAKSTLAKSTLAISAPVAAAAPASPSAASARAEALTASPSASPAVTAVATPAPAAPAAAPAAPQRNAALTQPVEQPQARASEPPRPAPLAARPAGRLGLVGPLAWPNAYEDVIGATLWPKDYNERLRGHGIGDVMATIFTPSAALVARARGNIVQAKADEPGKSNVAGGPGVCGTAAPATDWPTAEIERAVSLNAKQRTALDQLKSSLGDAVASIRATCRDDAALGPVERLRAMQNTLWAVHDAALLIRAPLAQFYDQLSDEQRKAFAAPASPQTDPRSMSRGDMARLCGAGSNDSSMRQFEQALNPTKAQRASLETLQKKSFEMGQFLMASCLKPVAATPAERLDAAADRLTAVIFAASTVSLALNDVYSQLSNEQKTRFNAAAGH